MTRATTRLWRRSLILGAACFFFLSESHAAWVVEFGPAETKMQGSIKYSVIGKYQAEFDRFRGKILCDDALAVQSVALEIEAGSIKSNCSWCDKIVRSERLLHTQKYPLIVFASREILSESGFYRVRGFLDMHGLRKEVLFPFKAKTFKDPDTGQKMLEASGQWVINRKDFDIIWNQALDKGGVVVGNHITVTWKIKAFFQSSLESKK